MGSSHPIFPRLPVLLAISPTHLAWRRARRIAMRTVASEVESHRNRLPVRLGSRAVALRKSRLRRLALESLEVRALLSTLPAATILNRVDVSNSTGDESTPSVAINPSNPQNLASVWVRNDPSRTGENKVLVEGAISNNSGASWSSFSATPNILRDPTIT